MGSFFEQRQTNQPPSYIIRRQFQNSHGLDVGTRLLGSVAEWGKGRGMGVEWGGAEQQPASKDIWKYQELEMELLN